MASKRSIQLLTSRLSGTRQCVSTSASSPLRLSRNVEISLPKRYVAPNAQFAYTTRRCLSNTSIRRKETTDQGGASPITSSNNPNEMASGSSASTSKKTDQGGASPITSSNNPNEMASGSTTSSSSPPTKISSYNFEDISDFVENPSPDRIIIDVREPSELQSTGRIPTSINLPIGSHPDFPFLSPEDFEDRFEIPRPDSSKEVVFYCKAGVRSRAAAKLAQQAGFGGKIGEFGGSWMEWHSRGGKVEH